MTDSKEDRSKDKLKRDLENRIMQAVDDILDIAEVAIGDSQRYRPFRSKVLRSGNNAIRELKAVIDRSYKILFVPDTEDIIEINRPTIRSVSEGKG